MQMLSNICERKGGGSSIGQGRQQTQCRSARGPASPTGSAAAETAAGGAPHRSGRARPLHPLPAQLLVGGSLGSSSFCPCEGSLHSQAENPSLEQDPRPLPPCCSNSLCLYRKGSHGRCVSVRPAQQDSPYGVHAGVTLLDHSGWDHSLLPAPLFMRWFRGIYGGEPSLPVTSSHSSL